MHTLTSHSTLGKETTVANYAHIAQQYQEHQRASMTESDSCTTSCAYYRARSMSTSTSRIELQCLQKLQI